MDFHQHSNGLPTLREHAWFLCFPLPMAAVSGIPGIFGLSWAGGFVAALCAAAVGTGLIFSAKLPLYRRRRFFTFGAGAIPESHRSAYRQGHLWVISSVAALLGLVLSR